MNIPILLTASVDTHGMQGARFSAADREKMYVDTLNFYIDDFQSHNGNFKIVFAENSGWPCESILKQLHNADNVQIEYIALNYNDFDQTRGKGYNELLLIDKTIDKSKYIQTAKRFFKLTGRFPIVNLYALLKEVNRRGGDDFLFYGDCKDHKLYETLGMHINGHVGECRYYGVALNFWDRYMRGQYVKLNDYTGPLIEDFFLDIMRRTKRIPGVSCRFRTQARFSGSGGHNLGSGSSFFHSTNHDSTVMKVKHYLHQFLRWFLPWWWC